VIGVLRTLRAEFARRLRDRLGVPSIARSLARLQRAGFVPATVLDVGAYRGDFAAEVLGRWPSATVACFEPLPGRAEALRARFAGRKVQVHDAVLGARTGTPVELSLAETASSVLAEHAAPDFARIARTTVALDDLAREGHVPARCELLKLDVQGYELAVLEGAQQVLGGTEVVLLELNLLDLHVGVPLLNEVLAWLAARGFVAWDVAGLTRRPLDDALWQVDVVAVRIDGALRRDKRWSDR
jgi:FkbM family methyltransferase